MSSPDDGSRATGTLIFSASSAAAKLRGLAMHKRVSMHSRWVNTSEGVKLVGLQRLNDDLVSPTSANSTDLALAALELAEDIGEWLDLGGDLGRELGEVFGPLLVAPFSQWMCLGPG